MGNAITNREFIMDLKLNQTYADPTNPVIFEHLFSEEESRIFFLKAFIPDLVIKNSLSLDHDVNFSQIA